MATYPITTTDKQETALQWSYEQSLRSLTVPGAPPVPPPDPAPTVEVYLQRLVDAQVLNVLVTQYDAAVAADLVSMVASVPPENQADALADIETVVVEHGGAAPLRDVPYRWSTSTAPPPRDLSIEADATQAQMATVTKLYIDHLDAQSVNRMSSLLGIVVGATIRIDDPAVPASALVVRVATAPIQRQGADGHVEIGVAFVSFAGAFADTQSVELTVED